MKSYTEILNLIKPVVEDEGFELFDVDLPVGQNRRLTIYIAAKKGSAREVQLDDCAKVSRRLSHLFDVELDLPGKYVLEVSSPGINRRLRRVEHFQDAVGEHVKIVFDNDSGKSETVSGAILECSDSALKMREDVHQSDIEVSLAAIRKARVDFIFDS
ncbi:MAG: ribosome maturation factor RimP [Deltaproteobacteria bacterium]|nr:ribosome maturation factor RimP [Deltaproteobacteria bacterium]